MLYYVDTNGCVNMFSNSKQEAIARKRAIPQPSKREKYVVSLEEAKRIIDEWIKEHS